MLAAYDDRSNAEVTLLDVSAVSLLHNSCSNVLFQRNGVYQVPS